MYNGGIHTHRKEEELYRSKQRVHCEFREDFFDKLDEILDTSNQKLTVPQKAKLIAAPGFSVATAKDQLYYRGKKSPSTQRVVALMNFTQMDFEEVVSYVYMGNPRVQANESNEPKLVPSYTPGGKYCAFRPWVFPYLRRNLHYANWEVFTKVVGFDYNTVNVPSQRVPILESVIYILELLKKIGMKSVKFQDIIVMEPDVLPEAKAS
mgnify:CR=1 FL=1